MIKIENVGVHGFEAAIRGMRNPLNSWDKSDSKEETLYSVYGHHNDKELVDSFDNIQDFVDYISDFQYGCDAKQKFNVYSEKNFCIGKNDLQLAKQLVAAGTDHSKFMRMITVTFDITAPMYWWKEASTYKVGTVRNSCSTMHTIHKKEFALDDFSCEHLITTETQTENERIVELPYIHALQVTLSFLNAAREKYLETKDKKYWWQIIQLLPSSYNQRSTVQLNYAVLRNIYHARKGHKLDEWKIFCKWIEEELPYSELITMGCSE